MYELEFIPKRKVDNFGELIDSTWLTHDSKEINQELLDFIENEFETDMSEFETVIVYFEGCYNLPVKIIQI